jgi:hypothetical protein
MTAKDEFHVKDVKASTRSLFYGTRTVLVWIWGKPEETCLEKLSAWQELPNIKQECQPENCGILFGRGSDRLELITNYETSEAS